MWQLGKLCLTYGSIFIRLLIYGLEGEEVSVEAKIDILLTVQEVCELLKVSRTYIYWLTHQKRIPHIKMQGHLRFRQSAIDDWLRAQEVRNGSQ